MANKQLKILQNKEKMLTKELDDLDEQLTARGNNLVLNDPLSQNLLGAKRVTLERVQDLKQYIEMIPKEKK